jgi:hypothetical protein
MAWLLLALQTFLSTILLLAAAGKALRPEEFPAALRLSHLPAPLIRPLSLAIPGLELGLALGLLLSTSWLLPLALGATAALFGTFTVWMVWIRARHLRVRCGCFGAGGPEIGWRTIARNGLLIVLAATAAVLATRAESPLPGPSLWMAVTVTAMSMSLALVIALREIAPHLILTVEQLREQQRRATGVSAEG